MTKDNASRILKGAAFVVDCFDNTRSRQILKDYEDCSVPVLHGGLYEDYAECVWSSSYKVPQVKEGIDVCDYPLARNIILLLISVMTEEIIEYFSSDSPRATSWSITLKDKAIKNYNY